MKIKSVHARQILDSRGNPTVECDVYLEDGSFGRSSVPSGASTGAHEAIELRDEDLHVYNGMGVLKAVSFVNSEIAQKLIGADALNQAEIDKMMIELDGTPNKNRLGANAILSVSLAVAHAAAASKKIPLYKYIASIANKNGTNFTLPLPMINIINGGKHGGWCTDIQEFMILPVGAASFSRAIQMGAEVFHSLAKVLDSVGYRTTVGDEGGYAPVLKNGNAEALELMIKAVEMAGYHLQDDIVFGIDAAASEFFDEGVYHLKNEKKDMNTDQMISFFEDLSEKYPIVSLEDPLDEEDWAGFTKLTELMGNKKQIVGDDLLVTNTEFLKKGIETKAANAILIKVNQIGTLTETMNAVKMAQDAGWNAIISHRSGETEDTTIAHLVVGLGTGQIKTGSLSRTDRVSKYNELLRIEEKLGEFGALAHHNFY